MQCILGPTEQGILRGDELPRIRFQPSADPRHASVFRELFLTFDLLQRPDPLALQKTFSGAGENRLGREPILNRERVGQYPLEDRILQQLWINFRIHDGEVNWPGRRLQLAFRDGEASDIRRKVSFAPLEPEHRAHREPIDLALAETASKPSWIWTK